MKQTKHNNNSIILITIRVIMVISIITGVLVVIVIIERANFTGIVLGRIETEAIKIKY